MTRSRIAAFLALAFIVLFCFSGVTATTTVKDATVSIQMGMPKLLFSLSSAPLLLIPLALIAAGAAFMENTDTPAGEWAAKLLILHDKVDDTTTNAEEDTNS